MFFIVLFNLWIRSLRIKRGLVGFDRVVAPRFAIFRKAGTEAAAIRCY
jgi:hypothetical protein